MKKIYYFFLTLFLLCTTTTTALSQTIKVEGFVYDTNNEPVIGATINVKGTSTAVLSDIYGKYVIQAPPSGTLIVRYVGFKTVDLLIDNRSEINITLAVDATDIEEVVVVGYGRQNRSSMTSSIASVSPKELSKQVSSNLASSIQGRVSGVDVIQSGGIAGVEPSIVIRGAASLTATEPLYIIDGAFSNSGLSSVNAADIESMEILKDGSAAAIYGSRAANGVVIITTKTGRKGAPKIEATASFSVQTIANIPDFLNAEQWRSFANMVSDNSGLARAPENVNPTDPTVDTKWQDLWLQFAPVYSMNASISGGGEVGTYGVSLNYYDQTGMTLESGYQKLGARVNTQFKKGIFTFTENLSVNYRNKKPTASFNIGLPTLPLQDAQGRYASWGSEYYIESEDARRNNPFPGIYATDSYSKTVDIMGGFSGVFKILEGFTFTSSLNGAYTTVHGYTHTPQYYTKWFSDGTPDPDYGNPKNSLSESRSDLLNYSWDNLLNLDRKFGKHSVNALLGMSYTSESYRKQSQSTINDLGGSNITGFDNLDGKISAAEQNFILLSFFARINYSYDDRYLFSASVRRDESSKFHKDNRVGYFPSISAGWNMHNEDWFKNNVVSKLKITGSYGELGANFLAPYNFDPIAFGPIAYTIAGQRFTDGRAAYLKSKDLKWETSKTYNVGLDLGFFNNALTIGANYFYKKNVDILTAINLNLSSGQIFEINTSNETPFVNSASVQNRGVELFANFSKTVAKDLFISVTANFTYLDNYVLALGDNVQPISAGAYSGAFNDAPSITQPGYAIGSFYGYQIDGFDHQGNFAYRDNDGDGKITAADKAILGNGIPKYSYGLNIDVNYKGFDLTMFFNGVADVKIFNATRYNYYFNYSNNVVAGALNAWRPDNTETNVPVMKVSNADGGNSLPSDFYIEDGSYFRLTNLQLGYSIDAKTVKKWGLSNLRFFIGCQNVFTITKYSGYDPQVSGNALFARGIDNNSFPNSRVYTFGLNLSF